jgi:biopolymer transport protein ExbB
MLYDLIGRFARIGGECALGVLFLVSIVSVALICDRSWFFARRRLDIDAFAQRLLPLLRSQDWSGARSVAQQSPASSSLIVLAGLSQVGHGSDAVHAVMRSALARERMRLEAHLGLLRALGLAALLVGLLGTVFDLWEFLNSLGVPTSGKTVFSYQGISVLASLAAGLLAATPALFVASVLTSLVHKTVHQIEFITEFVMSQLVATSPQSVEFHKPYPARAA